MFHAHFRYIFTYIYVCIFTFGRNMVANKQNLNNNLFHQLNMITSILL